MTTICLPAGTTHVRFGELDRLIADAQHPATGPDDERFSYHAARINLEGDLKAAVTRGALPVKDALTHGPHPFPHGDALNDALVMVDDLRSFVAGRGVAVVVGEPDARQSAPAWHPVPLHSRLLPRTPWRGGRIEDTDVLTLQEAAAQAGEHAGRGVSVGDFLRAGARGEIALRAVVHRTAETRPAATGVQALNEGRPVPAGSIPTLPLDACRQLANIGRATWRTFQRDRDVDGLPCRFTAWELVPGEPDFETTTDDCRVMGHDVHALADAFAPEGNPAADGPQAAPESAEDMPGEPEISVACLATREQILDAFEVWGFKADWFDNLKDRQWLRGARKRKGQGQRGQVVEPLFCPYEVMQGLVNKARCKRMSEAKGWQLLEHKFPAAYAFVSMGDPRERTG